MTVSILILAAGLSSRMRGRDKLLEEVNGQPLLRRMAMMALAISPNVLVALPAPPYHPGRRVVLEGLDVSQVDVPNPELGMGQSITSAVGTLPETSSGVVLLPGDMPEITEKDLQMFHDAFLEMPDRILRATSAEGTPGHPVGFPPWAFAELRELSGDQGARSLLSAHADQVHMIALPHDHAVTDLDTPEDWTRWREKQVQSGR
jgi:CTP:molybdopterin cytidylyltransferase MocA